jgi:hypothetical protein
VADHVLAIIDPFESGGKLVPIGVAVVSIELGMIHMKSELHYVDWADRIEKLFWPKEKAKCSLFETIFQ